MEPILTPALLTTALSKLASSAATAAGAKGWETLKALLTRHHGAAPARPESAEQATALAQQLSAAAEADPTLARDLADWHRSFLGTINNSGGTVNIATGNIGKVVQLGDAHNSTFNLG